MGIRTNSQKWTLGLIFLGVVVILWVLSSFLINQIFEDGLYRKPFLLTYINTASFVFYLLPTFRAVCANYWATGSFHIRRELVLEEEGPHEERELPLDEEQGAASAAAGAAAAATTLSPLIPKDSAEAPNDALTGAKLSLRATIQLSGQFCILWFLANLVTNASLSYTSVASQTILSSTSSFFTLLIGSLFHVESVNRVKVLGSVISFVGIVFVTKSDADNTASAGEVHSAVPYKFHNGISSDNTEAFVIFCGNLLALAGALFYGLYCTLLKWRIRDETRVNMKIFFGFVGLFTLVLLWPTVVLLHFLGWETFELPPTPQVLAIVLFNCVITFISDFCWAKAMLLTSPLTVTVGLSTTIPFAMLGDFLFKSRPMSFIYLLGAALICASFFIVNKESEEEFQLDEHQSVA
ncbi:KLTH0G04312p [Lachancea thermotolerans CBS 6340]|uniref:KLTH0G04312p n=1 Tax=Lachancea thermotolerans (strain ATCC 56472 / CBS 6340 / NRRL Y-8284) TaxID=559295 RepID=C5DLX6_LACTC|nr:KLTH0G04312p [Lachancea thermotolerans CBS 6340]CAR24787.1 KLTH0G04312p [Lachancea thermotolerans CBS 6340]